MTQKSFKEQLAEMQNNLTALDKIINATTEKKVKHFIITYEDGTSARFVEDLSYQPNFIDDEFDPTPLDIELDAHQILAPEVIEAETTYNRTSKRRIGLACIIKNVKYKSISHASKVLDMTRGSIRHRLDSVDYPDWSYAE